MVVDTLREDELRKQVSLALSAILELHSQEDKDFIQEPQSTPRVDIDRESTNLEEELNIQVGVIREQHNIVKHAEGCIPKY